jgi:general L-amino acid transport system permease protein
MSMSIQPGAKAPGIVRMRAWLGDRPIAQIVVFIAVVGALTLLGRNMTANMERVGITPGFAFLWRPANFEIGETLIAYSAESSLARAVLVGFLNTVMVSVVGCLLATVLGVALGIGRLSSNPLLSGAVRVYVEAVRNTPLLLQLFLWNATMQALPGARQAFAPLPGVFVCNRGVFAPTLTIAENWRWAPYLLIGTIVCISWLLTRRSIHKSSRLNLKVWSIAAVVAVFVAVLAATFGILSVETPERHGFNFVGGSSLSSEFVALVVGLVVNAAAGIAEIVRGGIESVPKGQWEAAGAIGLRHGQAMRLVVLPQALRVIIPLMTSSYLSLAKNSSLAVAIGYPDLVNIINTAANQTGQALEAIMIMVAIYLAISFSVSLLMSRYNIRHALKER